MSTVMLSEPKRVRNAHEALCGHALRTALEQSGKKLLPLCEPMKCSPDNAECHDSECQMTGASDCDT